MALCGCVKVMLSETRPSTAHCQRRISSNGSAGPSSAPAPTSPSPELSRPESRSKLPTCANSWGDRTGDPMAVTAVEVGCIRTLVSVPMFKAGEVIGAITIYRQEVRPFTDKQVELVT